MTLQSRNIHDYLINSEIIDFNSKVIIEKCHEFKKYADKSIELAEALYHFVRDEISHSADIDNLDVTVRASDVLIKKHGICHAKSNLLAAMLRYFKIPSGFCYQTLCSDEDSSIKILHGFNAVYLEKYDKWIRVDARGNKEGVDAQFNTEREQLAWTADMDLGEKDYDIVYVNPNEKIIDLMLKSKDRNELWSYICFNDDNYFNLE